MTALPRGALTASPTHTCHTPTNHNHSSYPKDLLTFPPHPSPPLPPPKSERRPRSLIEGRGLPKMWRLTNGICLSHVGLTQDSRVLLLAAQHAALEHENRFGEHIPLGELVEVVAGKQQEATMQGSKRPYGSSILVAGLLPDLQGPASIPSGSSSSSSSSSNRRREGVLFPRIYRTDPSGAYTLWKACALGQGAEKVMAMLEEKYLPEMGVKEALNLALECCRVLAGGGGGGEKKEEVGKGGREEEEEDGGKGLGLGGEEEEEEELVVAGVDVALISREGVRMWEGVSPVEKLLDLVEEEEEV